MSKFVMSLMFVLCASFANHGFASSDLKSDESAETLAQIKIPNDKMHLAFIQKQDDGWFIESSMVVFHGNMTLNGNLTLHWNDSDELDLMFTPFHSHRDLPYIDDSYDMDDIDITLNQVYLDQPRKYDENTGKLLSTHQPLPNNIDLVKKAFLHLPQWFWQERTGAISRPAKVTLNAFGIQTVCGIRMYYATATNIEPLDNKHQEPSEEMC